MELEQLKTVSLFEGLNAAQLAKVAALIQERRVAVGEYVFHEGEGGDEFYVVLAGRIRISKVVPGVGEEALAILDPTPRSADALAHSDCTLGAFRREDFDHLMFTDKELAYSVLWTFVRTLSTRLRETNEKIRGFFALSARF
jgi:CRP-like cAMP-binding protein